MYLDTLEDNRSDFRWVRFRRLDRRERQRRRKRSMPADPRRRFVRCETRVRAHAGGQTIIEYAYKTRSCCGRVMPNKPVAGSYWHTSLCSCPVSTPISNRAYRKYTVDDHSEITANALSRDPCFSGSFAKIFNFENFIVVVSS